MLGFALGNIEFVKANIELLLAGIVVLSVVPPALAWWRSRRLAQRGRRAMSQREIHSWLTDMDGVLVHEGTALPGAVEFVRALRDVGRPFLILTNNSSYTPRDLRARLVAAGLDVPEESIWTSALATATFLSEQEPGGSAYAIGEAGLTTALHEAGYTLTDTDPDYVVLGETRTYSFEALTKAIRLVQGGAKFIATNPDVSRPERGRRPAGHRAPWPR